MTGRLRFGALRALETTRGLVEYDEGHYTGRCRCTPDQVLRYRRKGVARIDASHVAEAIQYRRIERAVN